MGKEGEFSAAVGSIYEAALDEKLWPKALTSLADFTETAHIALCAMDRRAQSYHALAPRTDPDWDACYKQYWAFRDPLWAPSAKRPANEVFYLDDLMPRGEFVATAIYNEWFRPAGFGLGLMGANLQVSEEASSLIMIANAPGEDHITPQQARIFKALLPHIARAVRLHRDLRLRDLDQLAAPDTLEQMGFGAILVDSAAKVLFANAWARALIAPGSGLAVRDGYLFSTDRDAILHRLIRSCGGRLPPPYGPGGEIVLRRSARRPVRVTVTPLRARGNVPELPWLGVQMPAAMVTIRDPAKTKWLN
jgi:hypothetical protein